MMGGRKGKGIPKTGMSSSKASTSKPMTGMEAFRANRNAYKKSGYEGGFGGYMMQKTINDLRNKGLNTGGSPGIHNAGAQPAPRQGTILSRVKDKQAGIVPVVASKKRPTAPTGNPSAARQRLARRAKGMK